MIDASKIRPASEEAAAIIRLVRIGDEYNAEKLRQWIIRRDEHLYRKPHVHGPKPHWSDYALLPVLLIMVIYYF